MGQGCTRHSPGKASFLWGRLGPLAPFQEGLEVLQLKGRGRGMVGPVAVPDCPGPPPPPRALTSWVCRRLVFHSSRMSTSHCLSVVGFRRGRGRIIGGCAPAPICLPWCWLFPIQAAPALEASAFSFLKQSLQQPEVTCPGASNHPPSIPPQAAPRPMWGRGPGSPLPLSRVLWAPGGGLWDWGLSLSPL